MSPNTGEIWVAELNAQQIRSFPSSTRSFSSWLGHAPALARRRVIQDQYGDLNRGEATNRVLVFPAWLE